MAPHTGAGTPTTLYGGAGSDTLDGSGTGWDEACYVDQGAGVVANSSGQALACADRSLGADRMREPGSGAVDPLISIEGFTGSNFNDGVVPGRSSASLGLTPGMGNDTAGGRCGRP